MREIIRIDYNGVLAEYPTAFRDTHFTRKPVGLG